MSPEKRHTLRRSLAPAAALLVAAATAVLFWRPLAGWFTGKPVGSGSSPAVIARVGGLTLEASLAPEPPRQEGNTLILHLRDAAGLPVDGARVDVTYFMSAMGSMPEMRGEAEVNERSGGRYEARFDLPMGGNWTLTTEIEADPGSGRVELALTVGSPGLRAVSESQTEPAPEDADFASLPSVELPDDALARLRAAFDAYEEARGLLARDSLDGLDGPAAAVRAALDGAAEGLADAPSALRACLAQAADAVRRLADATEIEEARRRFGEVSLYLVALAGVDPRLQEGWNVFRCPMAEGFPKWFQRAPEIENPYMGTRMPQCGVVTEWSIGEAAPAPAALAEGEIAYYTCSMHPSVRQQAGGICPICSMGLVPVSREEAETGVIFVDQQRRQRIGVRTGRVEHRRLRFRVRAVGEVRYDEARLTDVNLRAGGWVQDLLVSETGQRVEEGQTLFTLYSPELLSAQQELLTARATDTRSDRSRENGLLRPARRRLRLLGLSDAQIRELESRGEALEDLPILAPAGGYVIEKHVVQGAHVAEGTRVYRIAALDRVWVEAQVYEADLPLVRAGQPARVTLTHMPGRPFEGQVAYLYPYLDDATRTGRIRVELPNPRLDFRPAMYANVEIEADFGDRLTVPESAVVYTGPRRLVFVDLGEGRLRPKEVRLGLRSGEHFEVLDGLQAGDRVVTSGNFLIAAESRIRSAAKYWGATDAAR
jgi:Cu(I)/Ag(I) efflux system membrane fusion protein